MFGSTTISMPNDGSRHFHACQRQTNPQLYNYIQYHNQQQLQRQQQLQYQQLQYQQYLRLQEQRADFHRNCPSSAPGSGSLSVPHRRPFRNQAMSSQGIKIENENSLDFDTNSLMFDLNELLKRDPDLTSLQPVKEESNYFNSSALPIPPKRSPLHNPMLEQGLFSELDDVLATSVSSPTSVNAFGSSVGSSASPALTSTSPSLYAPTSTPTFGFSGPVPNVTIPRNSSLVKMECDFDQSDDQSQPTLTMLNSAEMSENSLLKLELNDLDVDFNQYFINDSSRDVSFGAPPYTSTSQSKNILRPSTSTTREGGGKPISSSIGVASSQTPSSQGSNFIQGNDDQFPFATSSYSSQSGGTTFGSKDLLSSSVPANIFQNSPLSDILSDFTSTCGTNTSQATSSSTRVSPSVSPHLPSHSPSHAGPERTHHSQLHKLLLRREHPVGSRPSPVRSPESRQQKATLERIRTNLSASNPLLTQQLSKSAPNQQSFLEKVMWARREPRQHISSVCSVGNESSIADEVSEVLSGISPSDLPDIESDDEESQMDENQEGDTSDEEDSDDEDGGQGSSAGSKKKERHFWQYNVQAKGPKGQKIVVETKIEDPHHLNEIVDPVFSGNVQMQGIKHSGKARRGDGNDLTANPKKLAAIGRELDQLSRVINDLTPPSEMPFNTRCKSRKEKNKMASRACRLKKKAQHEANKLKCYGLEEEHHDLSVMITRAREILRLKVDGTNSNNLQADLTNEMDALIKKSAKNRVAGHTTEYVNRKIEPYMKDS
ncbi:uncharacterized protein LOC131880347 isoform X2 [Tigriopus californicus]|uniref:uncharacterized protein LOC131880347 isoform X2 n=2 Tax=Tigriopus californicus TaxID=6832 RepID=UPI0027D9D370|nr:uncharacterized protein LOC131880347 isoform X2 [Tigriopus californicus]